MNFAGVHKLPVVFVCENNRYAYSTPLEKQMAIEDVADRAVAYGFKGYVCSGNDLLAVLELSERMIARTRAGEGPVLIECQIAQDDSSPQLIEWGARVARANTRPHQTT